MIKKSGNKETKKFLKLAAKIALKSGCLRSKRGAVFFKNGKTIAVAFNTPLPNNDSCYKSGCLRDKLKLGLGKELEKCRAIHAEAKTIAEAANKGLLLKDTTAYLTCMPCINCAKLLITAGIKEVYYLDNYGDITALTLLEKMKIKCQRIKLKNDKAEKRLRDKRKQ